MTQGLRRIGVLGGMGPEATIYFMQRIVAAVSARDDADHIPLLVDNNTQVPSRIAAILEGSGADPGPVLVSMAQHLQQAGAEALVMPCNTAHHFARQVADASDVPFLNMVDLASAHAASLVPEGGRIGLLGSPALAQVGVFEPALGAQGLSALYARDPAHVLDTIRSIKAHGPSEQAADVLNAVARKMAEDGAGAICICCTEFSLLFDRITASVPVFDSLELLVDATVQFSRLGTVQTQR